MKDKYNDNGPCPVKWRSKEGGRPRPPTMFRATQTYCNVEDWRRNNAL